MDHTSYLSTLMMLSYWFETKILTPSPYTHTHTHTQVLLFLSKEADLQVNVV